MCEWCPVVDRKIRAFAGRRKTIPTISYKTFQPTEQVANFVIPLCAPLCRLKSARRTRSFIVLRTSRPFPAATFRGRVFPWLLLYFLFRCCYLQKLIDANVSTFVRPDLDKVTKMADKADSRAPFHLILEGLRCTSPTSSLDSTRRSSSHPHINVGLTVACCCCMLLRPRLLASSLLNKLSFFFVLIHLHDSLHDNTYNLTRLLVETYAQVIYSRNTGITCSHSHFVCASLGTRVHTTRSLSHSLSLSLSLSLCHSLSFSRCQSSS